MDIEKFRKKREEQRGENGVKGCNKFEQRIIGVLRKHR